MQVQNPIFLIFFTARSNLIVSVLNSKFLGKCSEIIS